VLPTRLTLWTVSVCIASSVAACVSLPRGVERAPPSPRGTRLELGLAGNAKVLCSAVFVSGRDAGEAWEHSAQAAWMPADAGLRWRVDAEERAVHVSAPEGTERVARYFGDQGCVIAATPGSIAFTPERLTHRFPPPGTPWPVGDDLGPEAIAPDVDRAHLAAAVDAAFADPAALTAAFIVVHRGKIIAERYGAGASRDMPLESWSMGKSLTATLLGLLVKQGVYDVQAPAPVPGWAADERRAIRIIDLLHMSSGLRFISSHDPDYTPALGYADHDYIYTGGIDAFEYSIRKPAQFPPNTEGRYRNSDPLTIGYLVRKAVEARGEDYLSFPQRALFDRLGMHHMVLETDPFGNFLLTGHDYGTARDWARLGLLYQQDGVWQGERLLPEGWTTLVSTPAPAWKKPEYGGLFWLNRTGDWPVPESAYLMIGASGQKVFVVPSHELVVVRMGHTRGGPVHAASLKAALKELMAAVPPKPAP